MSERPRSKFEERFEKRMADVKNDVRQLAETIARVSPVIFEELKSVAKHPRSFGSWLETKSPWLNRRFLGVASNLAEPFLAGMGLAIERLTEEAVEVSMPGSLRNRGEGGLVHTGALVALGEFAARIFWEHHLDLRSAEIYSRRAQVRLLSRPTGALKAVFRIDVAAREEALLRLRADGFVEIESQTGLYDERGKLVAEVEVDWRFERQRALGGARS